MENLSQDSSLDVVTSTMKNTLAPKEMITSEEFICSTKLMMEHFIATQLPSRTYLSDLNDGYVSDEFYDRYP